MCENYENGRRQRTSFDYGYDPFGEKKSSPRENPFHRRAFSDRREYKRPRDSNGFYGSIAKRRRSDPHPIFDGYQLVGDSLLLRFAEQILFERCIYENGMRYLGLCVSGQTIEELTTRIEERFSPLGEKIILLIGTNNIIQHKCPNEMTDSLKKLLDILDRIAKKIVILTLPPIPKLENTGVFWYKFNQYNSFIRSQSERKNVTVQDISTIYLNEDNECKMEYFEQWYDKSHRRPDLIHLNKTGLLQIMKHLRLSRALESDTEDDEDSSDEDSHSSTSSSSPTSSSSSSDEECKSLTRSRPNLDSD